MSVGIPLRAGLAKIREDDDELWKSMDLWGVGNSQFLRPHSGPENLPSGKRLHNYGKSPFFMGKLTISMAIFNSFLYVYKRVSPSS